MRTPKPLSRIVAGDPLLASWDARRRHESALTQAVRAELPRQLAERVRVDCAQHETIEIVADSGAVAAAVRQRLPAVQGRLSRGGHALAAIKVRVHVRTWEPVTPKAAANRAHDLPTATLARFAQAMAPGPLRTSLDR
jgi:hypothetical protein